MWDKILGLFSSGKNPIDSIFEGIDKLVTSDEEKEVLRLEALKLSLAEQGMKMKDKQDARGLYKTDSWAQKVYAIVFLVSYIGLSAFIIYYFFTGAILAQTASNFVFTIFGAMSTKVSTITDFFFGSSDQKNDVEPRK